MKNKKAPMEAGIRYYETDILDKSDKNLYAVL